MLVGQQHRRISTSLHNARELYVVMPLRSHKNFRDMHMVSEEIRGRKISPEVVRHSRKSECASQEQILTRRIISGTRRNSTDAARSSCSKKVEVSL